MEVLPVGAEGGRERPSQKWGTQHERATKHREEEEGGSVGNLWGGCDWFGSVWR